MIVGFPGETGEDFEPHAGPGSRGEVPLDVLVQILARGRTRLANKRLADDVPEAEKTRRILALQQLQGEMQGAWFTAAVGTVVDVLVDGRSRRRAWELTGRTSGNTVVNFAGPVEWIGRLIPVAITEAAPNSLRGAARVDRRGFEPKPRDAGREAGHAD